MNYYVIEGIDCSGKSTQFNLIKHLSNTSEFTIAKVESIPEHEIDMFASGSRDNKILLVKEPLTEGLVQNVTFSALDVTLDPRTRFFLFLAQRSHLFRYLPTSRTIISDRSFISGIAYSDVDIRLGIKFSLEATRGILPQKIVILKIDKSELIKRLQTRNLDGIEQTGIDYLLDVQEKIIQICSLLKNEYGSTVIEIDSVDRMSSFEQICSFFEI